jgi:hypothetical protein
LNGYGWNCAFYSYFGTSYCTYESWSSPGEVYYDDDDFTAVDMCCACKVPTPSPTTPAPTMAHPTAQPTACDTATAFSIDSGDCTACGECFHTPNFLAGGDYDHSHHCTITPLSSGWLDVLEFEIEGYFDDITVDGVQYDGSLTDDGSYYGGWYYDYGGWYYDYSGGYFDDDWYSDDDFSYDDDMGDTYRRRRLQRGDDYGGYYYDYGGYYYDYGGYYYDYGGYYYYNNYYYGGGGETVTGGGPQDVVVTTSSSISFYSDGSVAYDGAYICLRGVPTPGPTPRPSPEPGSTPSPTAGPVIVSAAVGLSGISCAECA